MDNLRTESPPAIRKGWTSSLRAALLPALLVTSLNAFKPVHIDDAAYYFFASQTAVHPLDPLGFRILWYQEPQPAAEVVAPPVVPYWLAIGIRIFGSRTVLWKLWFLPFVLLFASSLHWLLLRFARGLQGPLVWMILFSPAVLPGLNLMLDVPSLGISLFSLCLFLHAEDRNSLGVSLLAGLMAGIAIETKYSALTALVLMATIGLLRRRPLPGFLAAAVAAMVFVFWEALCWSRYGISPFVYSLFHFPNTVPKSQLFLPALVFVGGLAPGALLLGFLGLNVRPAAPIFMGIAFLVMVAAFGWLPERWTDYSEEPLNALFLLTGVGLIGTAIAVVWCLGGRRGAPGGSCKFPFSRISDRILAAWFLLELVGSIAFSPFMAARRVLALIVVGTIVLGRYTALTRRPPACHGPLMAITGFSVLLGLGYFVVDYAEAAAQKESVGRAVRWIAERNAGNKVWYAGHWGFQHYADREGMTALVPGTSPVRRGDWVVIPEPRIAQQKLSWKRQDVEALHLIELEDALPFRTVMTYYAGTTPLQRRHGPRLSVQIYRARVDFVPGRG